MQVVKLDQRTEEWHIFRANGIGGSEVAAILGINPYMTRYQLFLQKTGRMPPPDLSRNPNVIRGIQNEDRIAQVIAHHFGEKGESVCGIHDDFPHIRCSFDFVTCNAINELKAPSDKQWEIVEVEGPHPYYVVQVEYQSIVGETLGLESRLIYWRMHGGKEQVKVFPVVLTPKRRQEIIDKVTEFWNLVLEDTPPDPDPERDRIEITSEAWLETASRWLEKNQRVKTLNDQVKAAKAEMEKEEEELAKLAEGFPMAEGGGVKFTKFFKRGSVDYKKVLDAYAPDLPEDELNGYRKDGSYETKVTASKSK